MTLLDPHSSQSIGPVAWTTKTPAPDAPPMRDPLIDALEEEVAALKIKLEHAEGEAKRIEEEARQAGRKQAEAEFVRDDAKRIAALTSALDEAAGEARVKIEGLDALALLICENALANVLSEPSAYRELIAGAIAKQIASLRREMALGVHVSAADFPDQAALDALGCKFAFHELTIALDATLRAGECRIDLRLGAIEISLPRYWSELKAVLKGAADEAPL
jgi:flagellar biosynthesis/type III secretory pathway protein FliH